MTKVAAILGKESSDKDPMVAVVRCNGTPEHSPKLNKYDGASNCTIAHNLYGGETGCAFGCLGFGDCVDVCKFDAIHIDQITGLPIVIDENCTGCGACISACPRMIIELRKQGKRNNARLCLMCQ